MMNWMDERNKTGSPLNSDPVQDRIDELREEIQDNEDWLIQTSNPMKIKRRKKAIKKAKAEINELLTLKQ